MNPRFRKIEVAGRTSRYLVAWKYEDGASYSSAVEVTTNSIGAFSELVLHKPYGEPVKLTKTDLRIIAELLRQGIIAGKEVGLQPVEEDKNE